ncbi:tyrosine-type recombinase/integrase [Amycolatopsis jejuensis]|uniref:tyrosine-type recombinase/integrase n=1 Tax=Amycolatopsis jejuensis TaxID=330084 RepID=UPI00138E3FCE|nr:site-specific integrase [Amycolatopsis jejuensis]
MSGRVASVGGFVSEDTARDYLADMAADRRRGTWIDPVGGRMLLRAWVERWVPSLDLDERTVESYCSRLRCHILPEFGEMPLGAITSLDIALWAKRLSARYVPATVSGLVNLLSMILADAVDERLIAVNPVHRHRHRRRGRRSRYVRAERVWATPEQVVQVAAQAEQFGGRAAFLLVVTAAWTGCRWGELAGLHRSMVDLDRGVLVIDRFLGSLHESGRRRWLGPPKTPSSARRISLPPFLVELLREHLETHPFEFVFTTPSGCWWWRSTFIRRVFRPAVDGTRDGRAVAVRPGLTFHGLRHSHKTWLIADAVPEIAQARRLGHRLDNRVVETYSHVAPRSKPDCWTGWKSAGRPPSPPTRRLPRNPRSQLRRNGSRRLSPSSPERGTPIPRCRNTGRRNGNDR